ncbi:MAG: hypothetical protein Q4D23_00800 [Bacteroidales bacterium]|nr:hypothetical protein [Bacteroidales bacterium]
MKVSSGARSAFCRVMVLSACLWPLLRGHKQMKVSSGARSATCRVMVRKHVYGRKVTNFFVNDAAEKKRKSRFALIIVAKQDNRVSVNPSITYSYREQRTPARTN